MAERTRAFPDNARGDFFVDRSCIDCETCYVLPGHGRTFEAGSPALMRREVERALARLRAA